MPAKGADGLTPGGLDFSSRAMAYEAPDGEVFVPARAAGNIHWEAQGDELGLASKWSARG